MFDDNKVQGDVKKEVLKALMDKMKDSGGAEDDAMPLEEGAPPAVSVMEVGVEKEPSKMDGMSPEEIKALMAHLQKLLDSKETI